MTALPDGTRVTDAALGGDILFRIRTPESEYRCFIKSPGDRPREVSPAEYEALLTDAVNQTGDSQGTRFLDRLPYFPPQ